MTVAGDGLGGPEDPGGREEAESAHDETESTPERTTEYDKLVRDAIPDIIRESGAEPETHVADDAEFRHRLGAKLVEEANEYAASREPEELADVLAVVGAICRSSDVDREELERIGREKARERGTFSEQLVLERVRESR
jgi:predicted house-cleaning noncanonical NTP pyrophosphatase (MazG superfamily)